MQIMANDKPVRVTLGKGQKLVRVVTELGIPIGSFIAHETDLPYLVKINKAPTGTIYFRWYGMKSTECI